jgi:methylated-DNA-[protein]-cysteine S-methyltransferase
LYTYHPSPVGDLLLAGDDDALHFLSFPSGSKAFRPWPEWVRDDAPFREVRRQLDAYFDGRLKRFDLPLHLGGTEFQRKVWLALADIPFGETRTYGWQAKVIGAPLSAARARARSAPPMGRTPLRSSCRAIA